MIAALSDKAVMDEVFEIMEPGDSFNGEVAGKTSSLAGPPLKLQGVIRFVGKPEGILGRRYVTIEGDNNNWYVISDFYEQVASPDLLAEIGVPIDQLQTFVVKSRNHFRAGFMETGFAKHAVVIDAPGHGPANIGRLDYKNKPADIYSKYFTGD